ncbi:ribonuclease III [Acuticoccus mangrovi]|uniref:Ribonuclease 3 n=1 Tax=Acuticoccus mangrovi TaxID=2796142 RepID=A0A934IU36_9HYPH|nr:ribonuclease III [Acuticoccus mangrovi]MBJ3778192.1 ribonuclease III [Acuticoccus mangrovi]
MGGRRDDALRALEDALGHRFADRAVLERALMHASVHDDGRGESYQRLEFLGDRVLGLAIASRLYDAFPGADEGDLARRLNALVRREACADRALAMGINKALKLGAAEALAGGRKKTAILADACEAVLAAVYLDAGFGAAVGVIDRVWEPLLARADEPERDPKTALQERLQASGGPPPTYRLKERTGPDHRPHFVIEVVGSDGVLAVGEGGSKREAEQQAARAALASLRESV